MNPLFRPEALAAQSSQFLGTIRIATAPSLVAEAVAALVSALLAFATLGQATRKAQVAGVLLPRAACWKSAAPTRWLASRDIPGRLDDFVHERFPMLQAPTAQAASPFDHPAQSKEEP